MRIALTVGALAVATLGPGAPGAVEAQATEQQFLEAGEMAPDFELPGATRFGVLDEPVWLSDHRGDVVVLAFFYRVRGGG